MNGRMGFAVAVLAAFCLAGAGTSVRAMPLDACSAGATGLWSAITWSCGRLPGAGDSVTIPATATVTLDTVASIGALIIDVGTGTRLVLNTGTTLELAGMLSSTKAPTTSTLDGAGLLRFVGGSRALFGSNWSATTDGVNVEMALDAGAVGTASTNTKFGTLLISSGVFSTSNDLRPDAGIANSGRLTIGPGATLITAGNIERIADHSQASAIVISGTLESSGTYLSANTVTVANGGVLRVKRAAGLLAPGTLTYAAGSALEYAGTVAQAPGAELAASLASLLVTNSNGITLSKSITVNEQLVLTGTLATSAYTLTLGSAATCSGAGEVTGAVQRVAPATAACYGHPHTRLSFDTGTAPASATIALSRGVPPFTGAVARRYTIAAPGFAGSATVRLHYLDSELNGANEANLRLWRYDGTRWVLEGRTAYDTVENYVELAGVTAFSDWALSENGGTTAATVVEFSARWQGDGVGLAWETADETLNAGFHLRRSASPLEAGARITAGLIPSQAAGGAGGGRYTYVDRGCSTVAACYYWLEDVSLNGITTRHGPAVARPAFVWLPLVER